MSKRLTAIVFVKSTNRKCTSVYGNPSYWVEFEPKSKIGANKGYTASDASCGYIASDLKGKNVIIEYHFTRNGVLIIDTMKEVY